MERLSMRKIKEVLRLKWGCGLSNRTVAGSCAIAPSTVLEYLRRATRAGLGWPLPEGLGDAELEARMFAPVAAAVGQPRPLPEWPTVHQELRVFNDLQNPMGAESSRQEIEKVADLVRRHDLMVLADEAYFDIRYESS